jgi:hypothetical protein
MCCSSEAQSSIDNNVQQLKYIKTYPNPVSTSATLNLSFQRDYNRNYSIQILNTIGKKMYEAKFLPTTLSIDLKAQRFYRGVYIYQLLDRNGAVVESGKILVVD